MVPQINYSICNQIKRVLDIKRKRNQYDTNIWRQAEVINQVKSVVYICFLLPLYGFEFVVRSCVSFLFPISYVVFLSLFPVLWFGVPGYFPFYFESLPLSLSHRCDYLPRPD